MSGAHLILVPIYFSPAIGAFSLAHLSYYCIIDRMGWVLPPAHPFPFSSFHQNSSPLLHL